jgi:hypothetical protein
MEEYCMYMNGLDGNRLNRRRSSGKAIVLMAIFFLFVIETISTFSPFDHIQVVAAALQENNNNTNTNLVSLSTISTTIGTGAAAAGAIVTVPGFLRARKQSKFMSVYLLEIHTKYNELKKTKPTDKTKSEYLDFLDTLRCDIIYLLQKGNINENHFKMLDDRITEYLHKANDLNN